MSNVEATGCDCGSATPVELPESRDYNCSSAARPNRSAASSTSLTSSQVAL